MRATRTFRVCRFAMPTSCYLLSSLTLTKTWLPHDARARCCLSTGFHIKQEFRPNVIANVKSSIFGNKTLNQIGQLAAEQQGSPSSRPAAGHSTPDRAGKRTRDESPETDTTGIRRPLDRQFSPQEVLAIDQSLARFCYSEALPFSAFHNSELHAALGKMNRYCVLVWITL